MGILVWLVVGVIAGFIAEKVMKRDHGILTNLLVGLAGSFIGGILSSLVGIAAYGFIGSVVVAAVGAVVLLWVYDQIKNRQ